MDHPAVTVLRRARLVVFDLDGTLLNSFGRAWDVFAAAAESFGLPTDYDVKTNFIRLWGRQGLEQFSTCFPNMQVDYQREFLPAWIAEDHKNDIPVFPGVVELLNTLAANNQVLALFTGRNHADAHHHLTTNDLLPFFNGCNWSCEDLRDGAPKDAVSLEKLWLDVRHEHDVAKHDIVLIGDSTVDAAAAIGAGIPVIIVTGGKDTVDDFKPFHLGEEFIFPDITAFAAAAGVYPPERPGRQHTGFCVG